MCDMTALRKWIIAEHIRGPYTMDAGGGFQCEDFACQAWGETVVGIPHLDGCRVGSALAELDTLVADLATARSERDYAHVRADRAESDFRAIGRSMCVAEYHIIEADAYAKNWQMRADDVGAELEGVREERDEARAELEQRRLGTWMDHV